MLLIGRVGVHAKKTLLKRRGRDTLSLLFLISRSHKICSQGGFKQPASIYRVSSGKRSLMLCSNWSRNLAAATGSTRPFA